MQNDVTASIVLFRNDPKVLLKAIRSFLNTRLRVKLYLIDNSPSDSLRNISADERCTYVYNQRNLGFGKAHNIALRFSVHESRYHLILNPDVFFEPGVLEHLICYMDKHTDVGQLMPKILYPDGRIQYSGKLLPTPFDLIARRLFQKFTERRNNLYELRESGYDRIMNVPHHLGCFMFVRTEILSKVGFFDERFFMYMEDTDLTRRIFRSYKTLYYPMVSVYHHYERGSQKKFRLMYYHIRSSFYYFNKWGWVFDKERKSANRTAIKTLGRGSQ